MKSNYLFIFIFLTIFKCGFSQISFTELVKQTEKAVVTIITVDKLGNPLMRGTGFLISDKGIILSNYHIFKGAFGAKITLYDKTEYELDSIISSSKQYDIIKFTVVNSTNIRFNNLHICNIIPQKGEDIFTIGNPMGLESTVSKGIISSIRILPELGNIFQITAPISSGSSGSPVLNMNGDVFGIASFQYTEGQNLNFAIDVKLSEKLNSNDAIFTELNAKKSLPPNKEIALKLIDSIWSPDLKLPYLNDFVKRYPNDYQGYLKRALLYCDLGSTYTHFEQSSMDKKDSLYYLGKSKIKLKSIADFNKALLLRPNESIIYYTRGVCIFNHCWTNPFKIPGWSFQSSLDDLYKSNNLKEPRDQQKRFHFMGLAYKALSKYKEAISSIDKALSVKNIHYDSLYNAHELYFERGRIKYEQYKDTIGALNDLDKAIDLYRLLLIYQMYNIQPSEYYAKRAEIRFDKNDLNGALDDLRIVNNNHSGCSEYTFFLQSYIIRMLDGDMSEALSAINEVIEKRGTSLSLYYEERARVYFGLKNYSKAIFDFNKSFELSPSDFDHYDYSDRSRAKSFLKDNIGAIKDIEIAIKLDIKNDYYYFLKGLYLSDLNDNSGAIKQYNKAIEINSKNANYYISRGWSKLQNNKTDACADWSIAGELGRYDAYDLIQKYCK